MKTKTSADSKRCTPVWKDDVLVDIRCAAGRRELAVLGPGGPARELAAIPDYERFLTDMEDFAQAQPAIRQTDGANYTNAPADSTATGVPQQKKLPVLLGSGLGFALEKIITFLQQRYGDTFVLAVVDKEKDILALTRLRERYAHLSGVTFICASNPNAVSKALTEWQESHGNLPLIPFALPFYLRLDRDFYSAVQADCEASNSWNFWEKTAYPKFTAALPRILLITSQYFLTGEIMAVCKRSAIPVYFLPVPDGEMGHKEFVRQLLSAVAEFKPDFALTMNHMGVDREGILIDLLEKLRLPLASWFVDNPHLILHLYARLASPWNAIFTWDLDNLPSLRAMGFPHVEYLPLGVDCTRFRPDPVLRGPADWRAAVSFVGNSMVNKIDARQGRSAIPQSLLDVYRDAGTRFAVSDERSVRDFFRREYPEQARIFDSLPSTEDQLAYETMLTWEATLQYRLSCIRATLPFSPLIVGDSGWKQLLPDDGSWRYHSELNYYTDLPAFYPLSLINFNCTSKQMKGAVNQRVFDVPATGSFLITDYREQVEQLFELGREIICYHSPAEAEELIRRYSKDAPGRRKIAKAARKRILAEHTYEHRITALIDSMRRIFG